MMSNNWTDDQLSAIDGRGGAMLVSAAAGSGKTAVLVERVIRMISEGENPCPANELLIVTFTRAAAAQMRERISTALSAKIAENPSNTALLRQQINLQSAKICTIDSFCSDLLRENFHLADIEADFSILDTNDAELLQRQSVQETLEELYANGDKEFIELVNLFSSGKDDSVLADAVLSIYSHISSYPDSDERLTELCSGYGDTCGISESRCGEIIFKYAEELLSYCRDVMLGAIDLIADDDKLTAAYKSAFEADALAYEELRKKAESRKWDSLREGANCFKLDRLKPARNCDEALRDAAKVRRALCSDTYMKKLKNVLCCSAAEYLDDMSQLAPAVKVLADCVRSFIAKYNEKKKLQNAVDFTDVEHIAFNILVEKTENGYIKTELAKTLSEGLREIIVDEYQDTNKVQDLLFYALSRDGSNLFTVGDVKQSIYSFRQAMPEIFLERRDSMPVYNRALDSYPAKVFLGKNFRSRQGITDGANFFFERAMTVKTGGLDYDENEMLVCGADYPEHKSADVELHVLCSDGRGEKACIAEAKYIAEMIKKAVSSGMIVGRSGNERRATYGDFCILLRSGNSQGYNSVAIMSSALEAVGIPVYADTGAKLSDAAEINMFVSLLRIIDNPMQDIPLTAVMLSPLFGFTADEMAKYRVAERNAELYRCICKASAAGDTKCTAFLYRLAQLRRLAVTLSVGELVRRLMEETRISAIVSAMSDGAGRVANLRVFHETANRFDIGGRGDLSAFLRYFDQLDEIKADDNSSVSKNSVNIMTIHKSKGLEFPICILARTSKRFYTGDDNKNIIISSKAGIGLSVREKRLNRPAKTAVLAACEIANRQMAISEEMRILYVAMTRAKEKFIALASFTNPPNELLEQSVHAAFGGSKMPEFPMSVAGSESDWLLPVFMRHPDCVALRNLCAGFPYAAVAKSSTKVAAFVPDVMADESEQEVAAIEYKTDADEILRLEKLIGDRLKYKYPYADLSAAPAKREASGFAADEEKKEFFAAAVPMFMSKSGLSAAQRGTVTHKLLQLCDFSSDASPAEQLKTLTKGNWFTEQEAAAVKLGQVEAFFASELFARIKKAETVYKEKQFAMLVPAGEIYPELSASFSDERIIVKGMIDCLFIENGKAVVVDYKTDSNVTEAELVARHSAQLKIYAKAIERCTEYEVNEGIIYSFSLEKQIKIY